MVDYRLFYFGSGRELKGVIYIRAGSDAAAILQSIALLCEYDMELWAGDRLVKTFPALHPAA